MGKLSSAVKDDLAASALTIRALTADAIEKAQSGHPGLPLGCAGLGALIYGEILKHNPGDPQWINRDRFILSAGFRVSSSSAVLRGKTQGLD